ncbi:MAG: PilZ domain-containing protein [Gemmataceae bacterium]|nr:PilZ domain-containing protein [Gemmata sp.]MDW8197096.1 PilZ domain-containing protein [Gemmataceae bacterium]
MALVDSFDDVKNWLSANLPVVVGIGVTVVLLTVFGVSSWLRRRRQLPVPLVRSSSSVIAPEKALNWEPLEPSYADRRSSVRREGAPVRVVVASSAFRNGVCDGYVVDRSTGGLKIAAPVGVAPGGTLQVRAVDAPDTVGFVTVIVRSCRKNHDYYELGCEFEKTPPWNVLLLFG